MEIKIKLINGGTMAQKQHEQEAFFAFYANKELKISDTRIIMLGYGLFILSCTIFLNLINNIYNSVRGHLYIIIMKFICLNLFNIFKIISIFFSILLFFRCFIILYRQNFKFVQI